MLTSQYARQARAFLFSRSAFYAATTRFFSSASDTPPFHRLTSNPIDSSGVQAEIQRGEIVHYFRDWFMSRKNPLYDRIFEILRTHEESSLDSALSSLNLYLTEPLILDVLRYDHKDVLCCLKFFDWAGRHPCFHHTRATFNAMFRILSKARLMSLMLEFLETYEKQQYVHKVRYHNILVIGYAIAGKCETALVVFGKMRFIGIDLDPFSYHVLLNSLVEHGLFDMAETVRNQIALRGFQTEITHSIVIKSLCLQKKLEEAAKYLYDLAEKDSSELSGIALGTFVDALCKDNQFEKAAMLVEDFRKKGSVPMEHAYSVWIRNLVLAGKLDGALEFLKDKQAVEGYVPDVFRYNMLIGKLLRENRLNEVYDLLMDMKERDILPDNVTMNSILSLLCKAGRMDIALDLYDARADFSLSVNYMAYNYLINSLVGGFSVSEAYRVLRSSIEFGFIPGQKTFSIIADDLCREGRLDDMKELVLFAIDQKIMPKNVGYDKFISALCRASRIEEEYEIIHDMLNQLSVKSGKTTYMKLIMGVIKSSRSDIAVRLFIEMLGKGFVPGRRLAREVIGCSLKGKNPEYQLYGFLEAATASRPQSARTIYNFFIDGARRARKPELASKIYEMMERNGVGPNVDSSILLLCSYLKAGQLAQALHLFRNFSKRWENRRLWRAMVVGLCRIGKVDYASQILDGMSSKKLKPSIECYEEIIKAYCALEQYDKAIELVNYMTKRGRSISSFIGNVFLLHALKSVTLYETWAHVSHKQTLSPSCWMLGHIVGVFSGVVKEIYDEGELEQMIHQCFDITTYTNNMLLRRMSLKGMEHACEYFNKLCALGFEPNRWSYVIMINGFSQRGQFDEAKKWMDEMLGKGFQLTEATIRAV